MENLNSDYDERLPDIITPIKKQPTLRQVSELQQTVPRSKSTPGKRLEFAGSQKNLPPADLNETPTN